MANAAGKTKAARALTHRTIESLMPEPAAYRVPDTRCMGLAVRVATGGMKTWDFAYRVRYSGTRRLSLGRFPEVSLEAARARANQIRSAAHVGRDLIGDENAERSSVTVEQLIETYDRRRLKGRLRTAHEIKNRLLRTLAPIKQRLVKDVKKSDLRCLFDDKADAGKLREAEARRQNVTTMFKWAFAQDYTTHNPAAGLTAYHAESTRDRILSDKEIGTLWAWLDLEENLRAPYGDILKLELLTGARCGEICGLSAEEINQNSWVWVLPAARSKNGKPRATPIVGVAREILIRHLRQRAAGPLFLNEYGRRPIRSINVANLLNARRADCPIPHFTTHDLRRTAATGMVDLGISLDLVGAVIGHQSDAKSNRTLLRHYVRTDQIDQKVTALGIWDRWVRAAVAGENDTANVVGLAAQDRAA